MITNSPLVEPIKTKWNEFINQPKENMRFIRDHYEWDTTMVVPTVNGTSKNIKVTVATQNPNTNKWKETQMIHGKKFDASKSGWIWAYDRTGRRIWIAQILEGTPIIVNDKFA